MGGVGGVLHDTFCFAGASCKENVQDGGERGTRLEPKTSGYKSDALSIRATTAPHCLMNMQLKSSP